MFQTTNQPFSIHGGSWVCTNNGGKSSSIFGELSTLWLCKKGPYATNDRPMAPARARRSCGLKPCFFGGKHCGCLIWKYGKWSIPKIPWLILVNCGWIIGEILLDDTGMYWMTLQRHRSTTTCSSYGFDALSGKSWAKGWGWFLLIHQYTSKRLVWTFLECINTVSHHNMMFKIQIQVMLVKQ